MCDGRLVQLPLPILRPPISKHGAGINLRPGRLILVQGIEPHAISFEAKCTTSCLRQRSFGIGDQPIAGADAVCTGLVVMGDFRGALTYH